MERYYSYSRFIKEYFGEKLYKICIDGGFTCPNRDGTLATGGCIFCSEGGSGEFTENASLSVSEQIHLGKSQTSRKYQGEHYIAYFQAFTNTYAPVDRLRALYEEAITAPEIVALSIGTRPDCITPEILDLLEELNKRRANSKKKAEKESVVFDTENSYGSGQEENHEKYNTKSWNVL